MKTGQCNDNICDLCNLTKETSDHIWFCDALKGKRMELDSGLAEADPNDFTPAMRHGVACALNADQRRTCWGGECKGEWHWTNKLRDGCLHENTLSEQMKNLTVSLDNAE